MNKKGKRGEAGEHPDCCPAERQASSSCTLPLLCLTTVMDYISIPVKSGAGESSLVSFTLT